MKTVVTILLVACAFSAPAAAQTPHDQHHAGLNERGRRFMGFDQEATTHHFILTKEGGRIEVTAKDAADARSTGEIRSHLRHIARAFGKGDFELPMLVHDTKAVPGVEKMKALGGSLSFVFEEIDRGARVRITGATPDAIAAVHEFLRFQITDHGTGDPLIVK